MLNLFRYISRILIWFLILGGLIVGGLRLTLANVGLFRADIESWVSEELASDVGFGDIRIYWNGIYPILELEKAAITLPDRSRPLAVDVLSIEFDLWDSLVLGTPVIIDVIGSIEKLVIRKDINNRWWLNDIDLKAANESNAAGDIEDFLAAIPHFLQLELKRLIIEDESEQRVHQIDNISADIQHHGNATHLQLLANLPEVLGGSLQLRALLEGEKGTIYLQTERFKLDPITALLDVPLSGLRRVEVAAEAWIDLLDHRVSGVSGNVSINKASYQAKLDEQAIPFQFSVGFDADKQGQNWQVASRVENLVVNQLGLPDIESQWRLIRHADGKQLQGWVNNLDISDYLGSVEAYLPDGLRDSIMQSNIEGKIEDVWISLPVETPTDLMLMAKASGLKNRASDAIPGINYLDAELTYARQRASIELTSKRLSVDFGDEFRAPFEIDQFYARADAGFINGEAVLSLSDVNVVNQDIKVAGRFWIESDLASRPFMSMRLSFDDGIGSQKSKYLPVKLLPKAALAWVDEAVLSADISDGGLLFHGRLENIVKLDKNKSGELYADFSVNNAELKFDPAWAIASQGKAHLLFHNMGIDIQLESISYDGIEQAKGQVRLPTYADTSIYVDISAEADTEKALRVWLASPVGKDYRDIASNLVESGGKLKVNIDLFLPLKGDHLREAVKVKIDLQDAEVSAPAWGIQLSRAKGQLLVTNEGISARSIKAYYFNDPVEVDVATDHDKHQTLITANGLVDTRQMLNLLPESLTQGLEGKSVWQLNLAIANTRQTGIEPVLTIDASSGLEGTAVYLPEPSSKSPDTKRHTTGRLALLANDDFNFEVNYGTYVTSRGRLEKAENDEYQLAELDIAFATSLKPQPVPGIRIYGNLPKLPLDEWIDFHQTETARQRPGSRNLMPLLQSIDLNITEIALFGRKLSNADFLLNQTDAGFTGNIDSSVAKGRFFFPKQDSVQNPVVIDMDYLGIAKKPGPDNMASWVPKDFFNMRFRSTVFAYDGREVSDLEIDTSLGGESLLIDLLKFKHNNVRFESSGYWLYSSINQLHNSHLEFSIKGEEFGQTVAALGLGDTIHNGSIEFKGEIDWPAEILNPSWDILSGKGRFKIEDGVLKDVEPGSGRFVGLLSLSALPRRLFLDFSDVLFDGLEFDEIKGDLVLDGPSLYTSNTKMDGPSVEIKIVGKTGLRDRDYDQKIYVVPKFRQALPLIGGAIAGSPFGWGLWLLQSVFKSSIDESVEIEYSMTGSWDDPVITVINEPEAKQTPKGSGNLEK